MIGHLATKLAAKVQEYDTQLSIIHGKSESVGRASQVMPEAEFVLSK
jgi:hypothetical protein